MYIFFIISLLLTIDLLSANFHDERLRSDGMHVLLKYEERATIFERGGRDGDVERREKGQRETRKVGVEDYGELTAIIFVDKLRKMSSKFFCCLSRL